MSTPFISGRYYDLHYAESESSLREMGVAYEDCVGNWLIFVRKAGIGPNNNIELDDQRIFVPSGWIRKAVELPQANPLDDEVSP